MQSAPEPPPSPPPDEDHGSSLLKPAEEVAALRQRRERPAELGRYPLILLGAVGVLAGLALWVTAKVRFDVVGLALAASGLIFVALGLTLHLILLRDRDRWPEQAHAWDEGIEIVLHDREVKAALWSDPKLALDLFVHRPRKATDDVRLLYWKMDPAVPPCDLSKTGFERLMAVVASHDLRLAEYRSGPKDRESRAYEIRAPLPRLQLEKLNGPAKPMRSPP